MTMASQRQLTLSIILFLSITVLLPFNILHVGASVVRSPHYHRHRHHHHVQRVEGGTSSPNQLAALFAAEPAKTGQGEYSCGPNKPCSNGACCGEGGWCGYGPKYCGTGCQSNCNAKAECGEFAAKPGQGCPLNVCCSQYGFCGTTTEFCASECQSNCQQPKPSGSSSDVRQRVIGYWEAWNYQHPCGTMSMGEIPVNMLTHLNVAFGYINLDYTVTNMDGLFSDIYRDIGNLKARNPDLKISIAIGGWTFNDPGRWQKVFTTMVGSLELRSTFIKNLIGFLSEYGYDGVGESI